MANTAITEKYIDVVHNMILEDRRLKVYETIKVSVSEEKVRYILHKELSMRKLCATWVSHFLNADQNKR